MIPSTLPRYGWLGLALVLVFWPLNWLLPGVRTHLLFFPLWLGYALAVDALVRRRTGTSLLTRSPRGFAMLFALSAPAWWLFELINWRTRNWQYVGRDLFSDGEYFLLSSLAFSTVMPAVFGTAELVRSFRWVERFADGPRLTPHPRLTAGFLLTGVAMLGIVLAWPRVAYPLVWGSLFFILEPLNVWARRPSLFDHLRVGDWRPVAALAAGALVCGFFWELWNYYAFPKWTYHTPGVAFWYVFEMPLLGYIGYLPFALELHALAHLVPLRGVRLKL